jgi:hypothetical protein
MNERIKEIILEHGLGKLGCTSRMEILAELIIKKCASLAEDGFFDDLDGQEICDGIKNHFGV